METLTVERKKKITRATFKSFLNKNKGNIYVYEKSRFDGMVDCVMPTEKHLPEKAKVDDRTSCLDNTLGIQGVWLVGGRDWFQPYEDDLFKGYQVSNCCGSFVVAILK